MNAKQAAILLFPFCLTGCAGGRIYEHSQTFGRQISELPMREVLSNLSDTVRDPHQIPSRTTFGEGKITITDTAGISASFPLNSSARPGGVLSLKAGDYIDQLNIGINPETDAAALKALRDLYRHAVFPKFAASDGFSRKHSQRWLYWKDKGGGPVPHDAVPPKEASYVGSTEIHDFYATDGSIFSDFVLETFGASGMLRASREHDELAVRSTTPDGRKRVIRRQPQSPPTVIPPRKPPQPLFTAPPAQVIQ